MAGPAPDDAGPRRASSTQPAAGPPARGVGKLLVAVALAVLVTGGGIAVLVLRQVPTTPAKAVLHQSVQPTSRQSEANVPPRPALTAQEESYANLLWPLHRDVEDSALRMLIAGIYFKAGDIDGAELHRRINDSLEVFRSDQERISAIHAPPSLQKAHQDYLNALVLYEQAATEMLGVDSREDHALVEAASMTLTASKTVREVGRILWPGEYTPN